MPSKGPASGRTLRILVVEDNEDVANSLATLLARLRLEVEGQE
jgi:CheY-like chemotaxis protein